MVGNSNLSLLGCDFIAQDVRSTAFRRNRQLEVESYPSAFRLKPVLQTGLRNTKRQPVEKSQPLRERAHFRGAKGYNGLSV